MSIFDKINKKYNVNAEDNMPQIVYGPPEVMRKMKREVGKIVFNGFSGGFGLSKFYYIEIASDGYLFKYGESKTGMQISDNDKNLQIIKRTDEECTDFMDRLFDITNNWERSYTNPKIMDGIHWHIESKDSFGRYDGMNAFPENYEELEKLLTLFFNYQSKYDIEPEDNVPYEVYGIPDPKNYDIKPEDNVPREVYGIPNPKNYDVKPENNVPQRVYGVPNPKNYDVKPEDNVPQKVYGVPNILPKIEDKKSIKLSIKNDKVNYIMLLNCYSNNADIAFVDGNNLENTAIADASASISVNQFEAFLKRLYKITETWQEKYVGDDKTTWTLLITTPESSKRYTGNGAYPTNWNEYIDWISEYEIIFKKRKKYDKESKDGFNLDLEGVVKLKVKDPFFVTLITNYFKEELGLKDPAAKVCFKDVAKYDDIFNEFTKYLVKRTYDIPDAVSVEGYTAKNIHELNSSFKASGVYSFLTMLRDEPQKAQDIIKKGFPNKDVIPPTFDNNNYLKLIHTPFHGCYGTKEELEKQKVEPIVTYYKPDIGKTILMDKISVTVEEITDDYIKLTVPYQSGIIGDYEDYKQQKPTSIQLKLNEVYTFNLDVYDAMETWTISFVRKNTNDVKKVKDKEVDKYLKEIEDEVDKKLIEQGLLTITDDGKKIPAFGSCHTRWAIEKQLLKERYNIDWQTPAEKNPYIQYD